MKREVAWRLFSREYNSSKHVHTTEGDKSVNHVITPLGAAVNRLFIVGMLTEINTQGEFVRARLADITGTYYISVGQFRPEVYSYIKSLEVPAPVALVGKVRVYNPDEDTTYLSVSPERIRTVDGEMRDYWLYRTAVNTQKRLNIMAEALKMESPTEDNLISMGATHEEARGILLAMKSYDRSELAPGGFTYMLKDVLNHLSRGNTPNDDDSTDKKMDAVVSIIKEYGEKGVVYDTLASRCSEFDIDDIELDTLLNTLMRDGTVQEFGLNIFKYVQGL